MISKKENNVLQTIELLDDEFLVLCMKIFKEPREKYISIKKNKTIAFMLIKMFKFRCDMQNHIKEENILMSHISI